MDITLKKKEFIKLFVDIPSDYMKTPLTVWDWIEAALNEAEKEHKSDLAQNDAVYLETYKAQEAKHKEELKEAIDEAFTVGFNANNFGDWDYTYLNDAQVKLFKKYGLSEAAQPERSEKWNENVETCSGCGIQWKKIGKQCPVCFKPAEKHNQVVQPKQDKENHWGHKTKMSKDTGKISDGYHTFNELYDQRAVLYIALLRQLYEFSRLSIWKSRKHNDGTMFDGMFILGICRKAGKQITYHLDMKYWNDCGFVLTLSKAPKWDAHTPKDVVERIKKLTNNPTTYNLG